MGAETETKPTTIVSLTSENVKRLSAVKIDPDGNMVVIGGANGQGKSSVLDSIEYALGGTSTFPGQPIRRDKQSAEIQVELGGGKSLTVRRRITHTGSTLEIRDSDGKKLSSPQTILDKLCSKIAFDPLAFLRMKPAEQMATLRKLVALDFSKMDIERQSLFEARADVNRDAKQLQARMDAIPQPTAGTPKEEVSVSELMEELKRRQEVNAKNQRAIDAVRTAACAIDAEAKRIARRKKEIADAEATLAAEKAELKVLENAQAELVNQQAAKEREAAALQNADTALVEAKIASADKTNAEVRKARERAELAKQRITKVNESAELTRQIEAIDERKASAMSAAKWPIDGLGFSDSGVTYRGLPFDQASSAEQLRVSVAMGFALNPGFPVVLIRDGSLLDADSLRLVSELAAEKSGQVWIERVGDGAECSVIIEDGHVKE